MRVYVSVDIEGVAGVVHVDQTRGNGQDFPLARQWMTDEANAAALGAFDAGATEVLINDSHGDMRNLLFDRLDPRVQVISGAMKPFSMAQGADARCDVAFFVGYHAGMGAGRGILDHTYSGASIAEVRVNGRVLNEAGLNALVLGFHGTPVTLVTGDTRCCEEARALFGDIETVAVKSAITRYAARSLHPKAACEQIRAAAARAAVREGAPFHLPGPYTLDLRLLNAGNADGAEVMPGVERVDGVTVRYRSDDVLELFRALIAMQRLADHAIPQVRAH